MTSKRERGFSCHKCYASITVVGPDSQVDQALRRVDWKREGNVVTCRNCLSSKTAAPTATCKHCGMTITYKPSTGKFLGGWVGNDHWGILCASQTYDAPARDHSPA